MKKCLYVLVACCLCTVASGQDIHFSQFTEMPLLRNPALAGTFDGHYRVQAIYRNQWAAVSPQPFQTIAAGVEYKLKGYCYNDDDRQTSWVGGLQLLKDVAGASNFTRNEAALNITGKIYVNDNLKISTGFFGGFVSGGFNSYKLSWSDQYVNDQYSPNNPTAQPFGDKGKNYFDLGAGVALSNGNSDAAVQWYAGLAAYHINKPVIAYGADYNMPVRWSVNGALSAVAGGNDNVLLLTADAIVQKTQREYLFGVHYKINGFGWDNFESGNRQGFSITPGIIYRAQDAVILAVKLEWGQFTFGLSYDLNTVASSIAKASGGYGAYEGLIKYRGLADNMARCGGFDCPFQ